MFLLSKGPSIRSSWIFVHGAMRVKSRLFVE
jgi:hypothetical protein